MNVEFLVIIQYNRYNNPIITINQHSLCTFFETLHLYWYSVKKKSTNEKDKLLQLFNSIERKKNYETSKLNHVPKCIHPRYCVNKHSKLIPAGASENTK